MKNKKGIIICMIMISILLLGGCGTKISHKSPEAVVKSLISAYQNQDEEAVKKALVLIRIKSVPRRFRRKSTIIWIILRHTKQIK